MISSLSVVALVVGLGLVGAVAGDDEEGKKPATFPYPLSPGSGEPARYGEITAHNACELLPRDFLARKGLSPEPSVEISERLPDPYAPAQSAVTQERVGGILVGVSGCMLPLKDSGHVSLDIQRSPYSSRERMETDFRLYREEAPSPYNDRGWEVLLVPDEDDPGFVFGGLKRGDTAIDFAYKNGSFPDDRVSGLVRELINRIITGLAEPPKPPSAAVYPKPYGPVPDPCAVLTAEDLAAVTKKTPSGIIDRSWTLGEVTLLDPGMEQTGRYIETKCSRWSQQPVDAPEMPSKHLGEMTVQTFRDETVARTAMEQHQDPNAALAAIDGPARKRPETVGDGHAIVARGFEEDRFYTFSVGRYVVQFYEQDMSDEALSRKYTQVARKVAQRLREA